MPSTIPPLPGRLRGFSERSNQQSQSEKSLGQDLDPCTWITTRLRCHLWSKQREIVEACFARRHVASPSAHDTGKSFVAAAIMAAWIGRNPPGSAFVVSTAPTFAQVRAILWRELARAHKRGALAGDLNQTEWQLGGELVAFGRKPSDYDPSAFQGIHAEKVLVVIDEAGGVPESIYDAAETIATAEGSCILAIGNPDDATSHFEKICRPGSGWHVIPIDGLESPNFTGEPVPDEVKRLLLSPVWVEERRLSWGEDDPRFQAKVRGRFPKDAENGVIPYSMLLRCIEGHDDQAGPEDGAPVELGVDVGAGGDESVIKGRRGKAAFHVWRGKTANSTDLVPRILHAIREHRAVRVKVDVVGWGWGVVGSLQEKRGEHGAEILGVNVGEASSDPAKFPKLRDEIWWMGRELTQARGWDLSGIDEETREQLLAPRWKPDAAGRVKIEPKDETKKRIHRSPDDADALLLAYYSPRVASWRTWLGPQGTQAETTA